MLRGGFFNYLENKIAVISCVDHRISERNIVNFEPLYYFAVSLNRR